MDGASTSAIYGISANSFDIDIVQLQFDVTNQLHEYGGLLREVKISPAKMESFLNSHMEELEKLALEYIKKIKDFDIQEKNNTNSLKK